MIRLAPRVTRLGIVLAALMLGLVLAPASALASDVSFGTPTAQARVGAPITFSTTLNAPDEPQRVELILSTPRSEATTIVTADVSGSGGAWQATVELLGHTVPNTVLTYQFRAPNAEGWTTGPQAQVTVVHDRFDWRTVEGSLVRLHWYEGSDAFGQRALEIGEQAVARASDLLGVTEADPIDFYIYASQPDLYEALGEGTREQVGGQAHSDIRTMFGLIEPTEINSDWVDVLVAHELTHLVFDTATDNPYRHPPRWLNEGVAVYLAEGYTDSWRLAVEQAAAQDRLIPLDGLAGLFPSPTDLFHLAYGESVSAVDYFVRTHGEERLWELVRSYAGGVSDDEAFRAAIGTDLAGFNEAWMGSLGVGVPEPHGPLPAPPGPVPPDWQAQPGSTPAPDATGPAVPQPTVRPTPAPPEQPSAQAGEQALLVVAVAALLVLLVAVAGGLLVARRRR